MGDYNLEYQNYYDGLNYKNNTDTKENKIVKRIIQELAGTFVLITFVFLCKIVPLPQAKEAYDYSKYIVKYNTDCSYYVKQIKSFDLNKVEAYISNNAQYIKNKLNDGKTSDKAS